MLATYMDATPAFNFEVFHLLLMHVLLLNIFYSEMSDLYSLILAFLDRFLMICLMTIWPCPTSHFWLLWCLACFFIYVSLKLGCLESNQVVTEGLIFCCMYVCRICKPKSITICSTTFVTYLPFNTSFFD